MNVFLLLVIVGLFSRSLAEDCPECQLVCGDAGVADCDTCLCEPSCESIECTAPRECVLIDIPCQSWPCPKQPTCIDNARPADVWESLNIESPSSDCASSCPVDLRVMCQTMTCPYHPEAVCVQDDCSCEVWFIDENEQRVKCEKEPDDIPPWILNGFDTGGSDIDPDEFDINTIPQSTPNFNLVVSNETNDKAVDQVSSLDVTIIAVATACVVLVLLAIVAVLLYKAAQKKKNSSTVKSLSRQQEEQLKPLNEPVPHIT